MQDCLFGPVFRLSGLGYNLQPIVMVDVDGNWKVTYITIINEDGSEQTLMIVDENYVKEVDPCGLCSIQFYNVVEYYIFDTRTGVLGSEGTEEIRRGLFDGLLELLGKWGEALEKILPNLEGSGGSSPGGLYLTSDKGGSSPTKIIADNKVEQKNIGFLLDIIKTTKLDPNKFIGGLTKGDQMRKAFEKQQDRLKGIERYSKPGWMKTLEKVAKMSKKTLSIPELDTPSSDDNYNFDQGDSVPSGVTPGKWYYRQENGWFKWDGKDSYVPENKTDSLKREESK